ncbi:MAG: carboxypeptidase-like regulatory domain-containing protein [Candidatus Acidiferrales bacterium]
MSLRAVRLTLLACFVCLIAVPAECAPNGGKITGVVVDASGTPQMGATVVISPEKLLTGSAMKLHTNGRGDFASEALPSGLYSVQVTLAGFLPTIEQHIEVSGSHATLLQVVMGSVFSSLGQLRQQPEQRGAADDWVWVLRSTADGRSVLRWDDSPNVALARAGIGEDAGQKDGRGLVEVSSGGQNPTSVANSPVAPGTEFAYDVPMGGQARFLLAGQFSYLNQQSATGIAAEWLPTGDSRTGPVTTLVVRQSEFGPGGPVFRGMRMSHDGELLVGDRVSVRYGGEYVYAGFGSGTSALRPRAEVALELSPDWQLSMIVATHPWQDALGDSTDALQSAVNTFDAFPTLMVRRGKPVFENGVHEEVAVRHSIGDDAELTAAIFHDQSSHTAVMGVGSAPSSDFVQGFFGDAFAYDGGGTSSEGTRIAYQQRIAPGLTSTVIYDYSGALVADDLLAGHRLRDQFVTKYRHSVATRMAAKMPGTHTSVVVGYKWLSGRIVSQQDSFGEAMYGVDPYLTIGLRQPLPNFLPGHMVVQADMGNILSQGGTAVTARGQYVLLVPAYRYFRGGLSFQF